jgi:hypothetical protein
MGLFVWLLQSRGLWQQPLLLAEQQSESFSEISRNLWRDIGENDRRQQSCQRSVV